MDTSSNLVRPMDKLLFPFVSIVGQEDMKRALLLNIVDPGIGGALIKGEKGTAKSTTVRSLSQILPPRTVVPGCPFGCDPSRPDRLCPHCAERLASEGSLPSEEVSMRVVELPLSATEDRVSGRDRDIAVTPLSRWEIVGGHVLSTFASGLVMSLLALVICLAYLVAVGCPLSAAGVAECVVILVPSALSGSVIVYAMVSFIRSTGAFSGFFTVVSVMIGFLAGIYMPMGTMPEAMQVVGTLVPASQMAALFRESLCSEAMGEVFAGAPADVLEGFRTDMGFDLALGGFEFSAATSLVYSLAVAALFMVVAVLAVRRSGR